MIVGVGIAAAEQRIAARAGRLSVGREQDVLLLVARQRRQVLRRLAQRRRDRRPVPQAEVVRRVGDDLDRRRAGRDRGGVVQRGLDVHAGGDAARLAVGEELEAPGDAGLRLLQHRLDRVHGRRPARDAAAQGVAHRRRAVLQQDRTIAGRRSSAKFCRPQFASSVGPASGRGPASDTLNPPIPVRAAARRSRRRARRARAPPRAGCAAGGWRRDVGGAGRREQRGDRRGQRRASARRGINRFSDGLGAVHGCR